MTTLNVLLLEDDPVYQALVAGTLRSQAARATVGIELRCHASLAEAKADLAAHPDTDAVIADLSLPDSHGRDTYRSLMGAHTPVVVLTADHDEAMELSALGEGVAEFLVKVPGRHLDLLRAILRARERQHAQEESARRSRAEEHQRRMAAIGSMSAGIAHEFNNLHAIIAGSVELMLRDGDGDRMIRQRLLRCQEALARAREITDGILDLARAAPGDDQRCRIDDVVGSTVHLLAERIASAGIALDLDLPSEPLWTRGHPAQLGQVVMNLCSNAMHALAGRPQARLAVRVHPHAADATVVVEDNGCGIPSDHLPRIFDPFFTSRPGHVSGQAGTGLGLAICEAIAQRHGGAITVATQVGVGSAFTLHLPLAEPVPPADPVPGGRMRGRVLVVDDEQAVRELLCDLVAELGMEPQPACNGSEAITQLDRHEHWDGILLDWHMPSLGGGGFLVERGARLAQAGTPVLVVTGNPAQVEAAPPRVPGLRLRVVTKPFNLAQLEMLLSAWSRPASVG